MNKARLNRHLTNYLEICSECKKPFRGSHWRIGVDRATGRIVCNICAPNRQSAERLMGRVEK